MAVTYSTYTDIKTVVKTCILFCHIWLFLSTVNCFFLLFFECISTINIFHLLPESYPSLSLFLTSKTSGWLVTSEMLAWCPWVSLWVLFRSLFPRTARVLRWKRRNAESGDDAQLQPLLDTRGLNCMLTCLSYLCVSVSMSTFGRTKRCSTILFPAGWTSPPPPTPCLHSYFHFVFRPLCRRSSLLKGSKGNVTYIHYDSYYFNVTRAVDNNVTLKMCLS